MFDRPVKTGKKIYYFIVHPSDVSHHIVGNELFTEVLALPSPVPEPATWALCCSALLVWVSRSANHDAKFPSPEPQVTRRLGETAVVAVFSS